MMNAISSIVARAIRTACGHICWQVEWHPTLNLSFQLGPPKMEIGGESCSAELKGPKGGSLRKRRVSVCGRWFIWVYHAYWAIQAIDTVVASTSSPDWLKDVGARFLTGQRLLSIEVCPRTGRTVFAFDLDASLVVRRITRDSEDELWCLHEPTGYVLSVRGDGTFDHEPGSGPDGRPRIVRRPLPMTGPGEPHPNSP